MTNQDADRAELALAIHVRAFCADDCYDPPPVDGIEYEIADAVMNWVRARDAQVAAAAARTVGAQALRDAADEVHIEARWQTEQQMRGLTEWRRSIDRLVMLEQILRDRAVQLDTK